MLEFRQALLVSARSTQSVAVFVKILQSDFYIPACLVTMTSGHGESPTGHPSVLVTMDQSVIKFWLFCKFLISFTFSSYFFCILFLKHDLYHGILL